MPRLEEGRLTFDFPNDGSDTARYDAWSFYRNQFQRVCGGAKAVDFVFVEAARTWLIEVKDYRQGTRTKAADLADEVAAKVRDTLAGLAACRCNANDADERGISDRALGRAYLAVVLHLEQPAVPSKLFPRVADPANLAQKLKQLLKPVDPRPRVVDRHSLHASMRWTVT